VRVYGHVVDSATQKGAAGLVVELWDEGAEGPLMAPEGPIAQSETDANGNFMLEVAEGIVETKLPERPVLRLRRKEVLVGVVETPLAWSADKVAKTSFTVEQSYEVEAVRIFGQALDAPTGTGVAGVALQADDRSGSYEPLTSVTGYRGRFTLVYPGGGRPEPTFTLANAGAVLGKVEVTPEWGEGWTAELTVSAPLLYRVAGTVVDSSTKAPAPDLQVEGRDPDGVYENPLGSARTDTNGHFEFSFVRRAKPPFPLLRVYRLDKQIAEVHADEGWNAEGLLQVQLEVPADETESLTYRLSGTAIERTTRRGAAGLRAEAWTPGFGFMLGATQTDTVGRFAFALTATDDATPPGAQFRFYRDSQLVAQPDVPINWTPAHEATIFVEVDALPQIAELRIAGRVVDETSGAALANLRVEAWDKAPRAAGFAGAAAVTDSDGAFDLSLPRTAPPAEIVPLGPPGGGPAAIRADGGDGFPFPRLHPPPPPQFDTPELFFRLYRGEDLIATSEPAVSWTPSGVGQVLIEITLPPEAPQSAEVGLHELGESIAGTVARVQAELARYPSSVGTYVLDEIGLTMPVEMRVDELGQVLTKVVDGDAEARANVGKVELKVKPLLGAVHPPPTIRDQPLSVLTDLSADAIQKLEAQRIFSVEDLARVARSPSGRATLEIYDLGVDLDALLGKAALLSLPMLPVRVRETLLSIGYASPDAFVKEEDAETLAGKLSTALEQDISAEHVKAWQAAVRRGLEVPLPTEHTTT
jgi:5-hydroxyisourate hydrolase-like protein (transthyretin family)